MTYKHPDKIDVYARSEFAFLIARAFEASMSNGKGESNA